MRYDEESIKNRKKAVKKIKTVISIILIILIYNLILVMVSYFSKSNFDGIFGYKAFAITTESMENTINKGDVVIVRNVNENEIEKNDIISFERDGEIITHRITNIIENDGKKEYITKGDNNNIEDENGVFYENIKGKMAFRIPLLGNFLNIVLNSVLVIILLIIIFLIYLYKIRIEEKKEKRRAKKVREDEKFSERKEK